MIVGIEVGVTKLMCKLIGNSLTGRINDHFAALAYGFMRSLEVKVFLFVASGVESLCEENFRVVVAN